MEKFIDISRLLVTISSLTSVLNSSIQKHNLRVAYISLSLAGKVTFSVEFLRDIILAGLFHDIGILFLDSKNQADLLLSDEIDAKESNLIHLHAFIGAELLRNYPIFSKVWKTVKYHHKSFKEYEESRGEVPFSSQIIFLADRIDTFMSKRLEMGKSLGECMDLLERKLLENRGTLFHPRLVDVFFKQFLKKEAFWFELYAEPSYLESSIVSALNDLSFSLNEREFLKLLSFFTYIIDFKSEFTATHSTGVAQTAVQLASFFILSQEEIINMKIAGLLHDIGKIAIPSDILEKPGRLTPQEFEIMKSHVFHTYKMLSKFIPNRNVIEWASYHHEKLNGSGYPFKLRANQLSLGARIMAVADIFTALTEDRPYKKSLSVEETLKILKGMVEKGEIDKRVVSVLEKNLDKINKGREISQCKALTLYRRLKDKVSQFSCS